LLLILSNSILADHNAFLIYKNVFVIIIKKNIHKIKQTFVQYGYPDFEKIIALFSLISFFTRSSITFALTSRVGGIVLVLRSK
jgi:hypothetical protein